MNQESKTANDCHNTNNKNEYSTFLTLHAAKFAITELGNQKLSWSAYFLKQAWVLPLGVLADIDYMIEPSKKKVKQLSSNNVCDNQNLNPKQSNINQTIEELCESFEDLISDQVIKNDTSPDNQVTEDDSNSSIQTNTSVDDLFASFEMDTFENDELLNVSCNFQDSFTIYEEYYQ